MDIPDTTDETFIKFAMCRACMMDIILPDACKPLFSDRIAEMFSTCTNIKVEISDGLPAFVCLRCFQTLYMVYAFKEQCIASDLKLKQLLKINHSSSGKEPCRSSRNVDAGIKLEDDYLRDGRDLNALRLSEEFFTNSIHSRADDNKSTSSYLEPLKCEQGNNISAYKSEPVEEDAKIGKICNLQTIPNANRIKIRHKKSRKSEKKRNDSRDTPELSNDEEYVEKKKQKSKVDSGPEVCTECGRSYATMKYLKRHILTHNHVKKFKCDVCNKLYTHLPYLTQHKKIHDDVRQFVCDLCGKSFVHRSSLTNHMLAHVSETPFPCKDCNKQFKTGKALRSHEARHISDKKLVCDLCGKMFITQTELGIHVRMHTQEKPYPCSACNKCFVTKSHLISHTRTHTGSRPYACDLCPKSFAHTRVLKNHRMTHTGEKPHVCVVCQRAFTQRIALTTHMKIHKLPTTLR